MILCVVVDDERTFASQNDDTIVVYCRTVGDALVELVHKWTQWWMLDASKVDELWLDHDLGENGGDINILVSWLRACAFMDHPFPVDNIYVHSQNPVGADNIVRKLQNLYRVTRTALPELERT